MSRLPATIPDQDLHAAVTVDAHELSIVLGLHVRSIQRRATTEAWPAQALTVKGGQKDFYSVPDLPDDVQRALVRHRLKEAQPATVSEVRGTATAPAALMKDWQRDVMTARLAILAEIDRQVSAGGSLNKVVDGLVTLSERGELPAALQGLVKAANAKSGETRTLSRRTIMRWRKDQREAGSVAPKEASHTGWTRLVEVLWPTHSSVPAVHQAVCAELRRLGEVEPTLDQVQRFVTSEVKPWAATFLRLWQQPRPQSIPQVHEQLGDELPDGCPMPSLEQCRRFLAKLDIVTRNKGRMGAMALLSVKGFKRRSTDKFQPLDIVTADGHTFKAWIQHPAHPMKAFCPEVVTVEDAKTRYVFGWSIGHAEATHVVMDAIRNAVETLGQFAIFYSDNGSGFVNEIVAGPVIGMLARVGATPQNSTGGRAQARGRIERLQGSCLKRAARELLTYRGRDMDREGAKAIEKRVERALKAGERPKYLMTFAEFREWLGEQIARYNHRPHSALPKTTCPHTGKVRHQTPHEAMDAAISAGWQPMMLPPEITDDLYRPYEERRTFRGEVTLPWGRYFAQDLVGFGGQMMRVGYDIHDGSRVWVRDQEGRLVAIAERDGNVIDHHPVTAVEHAREKRAAGQIRLLEQHINDRLVERDGYHAVESAQAAGPTVDELAAAEAEFDRLEAPAVALPAPVSAGRPVFNDDEEWGRWVVAHPHLATAMDKSRLANMARANGSFRLLLDDIADAEIEAACA
ncbi:Mu transposase C-terminal domain-containing protein [Niveispirillum sp. KHB5.9]|uniref:Mu transposase C-terminal domain-containing protein n=1 Tax=Niveispirillum sp. KHB5.9 TaxID=3400269 RepID=UPI003A844F11